MWDAERTEEGRPEHREIQRKVKARRSWWQRPNIDLYVGWTAVLDELRK